MNEEENSQNQRNTLRYAGMATQWLASLGVAVWLAYNLDYKWIGWKIPVMLIILPILTLGGLFWQLIKSFNKPK